MHSISAALKISGGANSEGTPEVFFRPWRDWVSFLRLFPRGESVGYGFSPSGLGSSRRQQISFMLRR